MYIHFVRPLYSCNNRQQLYLSISNIHTYARTQIVYAGVSYGASEHAGEDRPPAGGRAHALLGFDDSQAARIEPARGEREE